MFQFLIHLDQHLFHFVNHDLANPVFDFLCPMFREKLFWIPLYLLMAYLFYKTYKWRVIVLLAFAGLTILLCDQLSSSLIKPFFHRLRPCNDPAIESSVRLLLSSCGVGFSFVSSHAANHFGLAAFISAFVGGRRNLILLLYLWASLVSLSQVYVGVHYPSDILGGALLGSLIGLICAYGAKKGLDYFSKLR